MQVYIGSYAVYGKICKDMERDGKISPSRNNLETSFKICQVMMAHVISISYLLRIEINYYPRRSLIVNRCGRTCRSVRLPTQVLGFEMSGKQEVKCQEKVNAKINERSQTPRPMVIDKDEDM